jgi:hypothetical protein
MSYLLMTLLFCLTPPGAQSPQEDQTEVRHYSYRVTGQVIFSKYQTLEGATVYVMPATRPINGRIPFTHADKDGKFSIEFTDIPDEYCVCAHPGETGGLIPLVHSPDEAADMDRKLTCSKPFNLPERNARRRVVIRLR